MYANRIAALSLTALFLLGASSVYGETFMDYRGYIELDNRFSLPGKTEPEGTPQFRFLRSDATFRVTAAMGDDDVQAVVDLALIFTGYPQTEGLEDLMLRERIDPYRFESDSLYVEILDMAPGLDMRVGRQIVYWGSADQFNPTNVVNAYDFEDPIKFGEAIANEMLVLKYTAPISVFGDNVTIFDELALEGVVVPIFRPGQLPPSALAAFTDSSLFEQVVDSPSLAELAGVQDLYLSNGGTVEYGVNVNTPEAVFTNAQLGGRLSWTLLGTDMAVMVYHGFDDTPRAETVKATGLNVPAGIDINDEDALQPVVKGLVATRENGDINDGEGPIPTQVELSFPRVQVVGADLSTSLDWLGGMGVWGEFAMTFHEDLYRYVDVGLGPVLEKEMDAGSYWKLTTGFDYSLTDWWYFNAQYIRGFVDEFGAAKLGNYVLAGSEFKMFSEKMTLRLFSILALEETSAVIYPELFFKFWAGLDLSLGAFAFVGEPDTKFGSRLTGANSVFMKGRLCF
jgi:hypothetical protein